ncbi:MAG: DevR family CRISPR-associated autoregulator, partial [Acidobacteriota bacterium]|nr:DevR family CRISPR-associated autoregulator [Acidobacteriota bacterium]
MSKHLFGLIVTPHGAAANNRGENEGNITTLQKILWKGEVHTTVSAEAIRWALRYFWQRTGNLVNRQWNDETSDHEWRDSKWLGWNPDVAGGKIYVDDDVLGFMEALAASRETDIAYAIPQGLKDLKGDVLNAEEEGEPNAIKKASKKLEEFEKNLVQLQGKWEELRTVKLDDKEKIASLEKDIKRLRKNMGLKGVTLNRRGALEVTRAISLSPFAGDITFNAKSGTKTNTSLYGTELHATRYQYGIALTPESLRDAARVLKVVDSIIGLCEVAGNHSRFLYDFAPDSVVFRWTDDFAPRLLYGFEMDKEANLSFDQVLSRVEAGDIAASELFIGGSIVETLDAEARRILKVADGKTDASSNSEGAF